MNKNGSVADVIVWIAMAFITVVALGCLYFVYAEKIFPAIGDAFQNVTVNGENLTVSTNYIVSQTEAGLQNLDWWAYGIIIGGAINILLGCLLVRIKPGVAFVIYFLIAIIAFVVSISVSNAYEGILNAGTEFSNFLIAEFAGSNFVMKYLPVYTLVISFVGLVFMCIGIPEDGGKTA